MLEAAVFSLLVRAPDSHAGDPHGVGCEVPGERGYIGAVTRMGVRFRGVSVTEAS